MDLRAVVLAAVADFTGTDREQLDPNRTLHALGMGSSIRLLRLHSALEARVGRRLPMPAAAWTVERLISGASRDAVARPASVGPAALALSLGAPAMGVGVDIEAVSSLPETHDWRGHEFFVANYVPSEISYALLSADPRETFCGMFCAKEAVRKSHADLADVAMRDIQILHRDRAPLIHLTNPVLAARFTFRVSIAHADARATATVMAWWRESA